MDSRVITFRLPTSEANRLVAITKGSKWRNPSRLLRQMVSQVLGQTPASVDTNIADEDTTTHQRGRINLRLPVSDLEAAKRVAAEFGGLTPWIRALVQQHIGKATERPATAEIEALYAATTELWAIGKNLNQAVHRWNEAKLNGMPLPSNTVTPALLARVLATIEVVAKHNEAVLSAARRRANQNV